MDDEFLKKIEELQKKIDDLKDRYGFMRDYKLVSTIFDKMGLEYMQLNADEVNNNDSVYIVERNAETRTVTVRRKKDEEDF